MLSMGLFLVIMTNYLLALDLFMSLLSTVTVAFLTVGITSLSIGMGVIHADFKEVNPNKAVASYGGLMTMIYGALAVAGVVLLEAFPAYRVVTAGFFHRSLRTLDYAIIAGCFAAALVVALVLIVKPLQVALNQISDLEV